MKAPVWNRVTAYSMSAVELAGFVIGVARWRHLGRGQRLVTLWFGAATLFDILEFVASHYVHNAQVVGNFWFPVSVALALETLAAFQPDRRARKLYRGLTAAFVVTWLILLVAAGTLTGYSTYAGPSHALLILAVAAIVLLRRSALGRGDVMRDPAFLVAAGLSGYAVAIVFESLIAQLWQYDHQIYAVMYFSVAHVVTAAAECLMIRALFLPASPSGRTSG